MRIFSVLSFISLISLSLLSCSTLSQEFSTENIMKIHQGMSSEEIFTMFGEPKSISTEICGTPPDQWSCTTWKYGERPYEHASFTFSGKNNSLKLNNFNVDRN